MKRTSTPVTCEWPVAAATHIYILSIADFFVVAYAAILVFTPRKIAGGGSPRTNQFGLTAVALPSTFVIATPARCSRFPIDPQAAGAGSWNLSADGSTVSCKVSQEFGVFPVGRQTRFFRSRPGFADAH